MNTFYYSTGTCSTACSIAFAEAGLDFKGIEVSWKRNVNVEELAKVNPLGQVPVLVNEKGQSLIQTIAILEYIADHAPAKRLLPERGTWERHEAMGWLAYIGADFQKSFFPFFGALRWTESVSVQGEIRAQTAADVNKHLAYIDAALAGKKFLCGENFSVADAHLFTILGWCKWAKVLHAPYKNVSAYMKRVYERPAVQMVLKAEDILDYLPE